MAITIGDALLRMGVKKDDFERDIDGAQKLVKDRMAKMQDSLKLAGAAFTAVGVAGLKMVADARKINAALETTGVTLGLTTSEMREMALEATNVTFGLDAVTGTFELLARAGLRGRQEIVASATAIDTLGDAVGVTADEMAATLIPVWKAFGVELPKTAGDLDHFTWLAKSTTVNLSDFGSVLAYLAPEMDNLSLSMDDAIVMLAAMEGKGLTGSAATRVFRTAVTEAVNEGKDLAVTLGLTTSEMDRYRAEMERSTGMTQRYADAANKQYGLMDKLKQTFSEMTLRVGSLLTPLEPLLGVMTALGPVMIFLGSSMGASTVKFIAHAAAVAANVAILAAQKVATIAATAAQWALNVAMTANPIGAIVAAVALLIAGIVLLVMNLKKVTDFLMFWKKGSDETAQSMENLEGVTLDTVVAVDKLADGFNSVAIAAKEELEYTLDAGKRRLQAVIDTNAAIRTANEEHEQRWTEWLDTEAGKRSANIDYWYEQRLIAWKQLFIDMEEAAVEAADRAATTADQRLAADELRETLQFRQREYRRDLRIAGEEAAADAEAELLAARLANYTRFAEWRIAKDKQIELQTLQLKKAAEGLAADERDRLQALIASSAITVARAPTTRQVAWEALAAGQRAFEAAGGIGSALTGDISGWPKAALPMLPGLAGVGMPGGLPTAGMMKPVTAVQQTGYQTANISFEVDGVKLAEVLGVSLTDVIRLRSGA